MLYNIYMRLHRFFVDEKIANRKEVTIKSKELINQVRRVFRLKTGDMVVLFDGSGSDYVCAIAGYVADHSIVLDIREVKHSNFMPAKKIHLFAAIVKKDNFELIAEKATELGVTDIHPIISERVEKKLINEARLKKIIAEASEQSGRGDMPTIHDIVSLKDAITSVSVDKELKSLVFHTEGSKFDKESINESESIAVFIGPEGGWSNDEISMFHDRGMDVVCLGEQVLRAETAVVAALSVVVFNV